MKNYPGILVVGIIEILIGGITILSNFISLTLFTNHKTLNILFFVIIAGSISTLLGIGILKFEKAAYQLLLYFSSVVLLSKLLIFGGVIYLNGALETTIPSPLKNMISIAYHGFLIYYLTRPKVKLIFCK